MLPPSLSNKLPSNGGPINNEIQEGSVGSNDGPVDGSSTGGTAPGTSGMAVTNSTSINANAGGDGDVVMSDAQSSKPIGATSNGSDSNGAKKEQPEKPPQTQDDPSADSQMKDVTKEMAVDPPVIKTIVNAAKQENGNAGYPPAAGAGFTMPLSALPSDASKEAQSATNPAAAMDSLRAESKDAKVPPPLAAVTAIEEKKPSPVLAQQLQPPTPAYASAAAQFLGVSSAASLTAGASIPTMVEPDGTEKKKATPVTTAPPLQGPVLQLGARPGAIQPLSGAVKENPSTDASDLARRDREAAARFGYTSMRAAAQAQGYKVLPLPDPNSKSAETNAAEKPSTDPSDVARRDREAAARFGFTSMRAAAQAQGYKVLPLPEPNSKSAETNAAGLPTTEGLVSTQQSAKLVQATQQQPRLSTIIANKFKQMGKSPPSNMTGEAAGGWSMPGGRVYKHGIGMATVSHAPPPRPPPAPGMRELRVEDALLYLDDVKREFGGRPRVYNEFLAIMKNFKSQEVDTPGVIDRVSKLFRGNNHLILGFNKFLPDGYKISMEDLQQMDAAYEREQEMIRQQDASTTEKKQQQVAHLGKVQMPIQQQKTAIEQQRQMQQKKPMPATHVAVRPPPPQMSMQQKQKQQTKVQDALHAEQAARQRMKIASDLKEKQRQQQSVPKQPKGKTGKLSKKQQQQQQAIAQQQPPPQQPQQMQHQAVEFDHAISYVTTIKRRFANDENTYRQFLEILHTYQKEQRGIKEVLEQVAHLFQDHPDLLKEFTFFLPDAVQEQAKERLHRAAAESESRLSAQNNIKSAETGSSKEVVDMTNHNRAMIGDQSKVTGQKRYKETQQTPMLVTYPQSPETFVYNSAVERQFFDGVKDSLTASTRDGGQAWAEFMKCLDMYAQEILSQSEMLNFVEPLLGKANKYRFKEFKRILAAAGGQGGSTVSSMEDSWYSVPLSEIDFSRCRKCSPSYRALPRDYPAPPCSQRSDEEAKVLNNIWVSLPVGNEETFRHMRRNTHEEALFRIEDERFEIDMTIDSNLCTLALLEPFAQEMAQLSAEDSKMQPGKESDSRRSTERKGLGGKRFRYTFDPNILGVIHRNSITRIYGDNGQEMIELLKTNPSVAIPIVVSRLRQKDAEWKAVRDRLNRHWRDLAQASYYKSLDHRGLTWRTTDKKAISNRTLLADIKDRAANNGNESESAYEARLQKAKEEHGSFFLTTMGNDFKRIVDLSKLPKPDRKLFTPDMSLMYENSSCIQKDVYRILSFALERGSISPTDKERCHRLWTEFLGPWFNLKLNWMLEPAVSFQETSSSTTRLPRVVSKDDNSHDDESAEEDGEIDSRIVTEELRDDGSNDKDDTPLTVDHHPLPAGTTVSTIYGDGRIISCRKQDSMYIVKLAFGTAFVRPSAVLVSVLEAEKSAYTTHRMVDDHTKLDRSDDKLVIGTQSLYLFFRLHQLLCRRIGIARRLAYEVKDDPSLQTLVEQMPDHHGASAGKRRYDAFLSLVYALLDGGTGSSEGAKFEDRVRTLLGHWGYELATLDKLISHILKNIQNMANDDTTWSLVQLFRRHIDAGGFKPEALRQEAAYLSDGEPMYAFQYCPIQKDRGEKAVLYVESLGVIVGSEEEDSLSDRALEPSSKRQRR